MISTILKWTVGLAFSVLGQIIWWAARLLVRIAWWTLRQAVGHPRTSATLGLLGGAIWGLGWPIVVAALGSVILAASTWKAAHRATFDRWVGTATRTWARRWWIYQRTWDHVMGRCGLVVEHDNERHAPRLRKVATTPYWDRLTVTMQVGQELSDFQTAAEKLRHAFRVQRCAVREIAPASIGLDFMRRDPLAEIVPSAPIPATVDEVDFTALRLGLTEFQEPYDISVVGGHTVIIASSGGGKAGMNWNILRQLAPAIGAGLVRPVAVDPKGRELRQAISLFNAGTYGSQFSSERGEPDPGPVPTGDYAVTCRDTLALFERLVAEMEAVNEAAGAAGERDFVPTLAHPLRPILIDELAPLLAYWPRSKRDKIEELLSLLLTQGRAAGFIVLGCIQEPTKDVFAVRDLFFRRIGLRLPTESHTDAALTENAADRGALNHEIPESLPGVGFSLLDGAKTAVRMRLGYVTDDDIAELVEFVQHEREARRFTARRDTNGAESAAA